MPNPKADSSALPLDFKGGIKIPSESDEYVDVKYQLYLATYGTLVFPSFDLWKIENVDASIQFERRFKDSLKVSTWLKSSELGYENNIENVTKRGIVFAKEVEGMRISTGRLDLEKVRAGSKKAAEYQLIYCDVAVGRALAVDQEELMESIPSGYDSYYCPEKPLDRDHDGVFSLSEYGAAAQFDGRSPSEYRHTYFVKSQKQIIPRYVIRLTVVDAASYVGASPQTSIGEVVEFYDIETYKPVYPQEATTVRNTDFKQMVSLEKAYENAIAECENPDTVTSEKKDIIQGLLESLDAKVRSINLNYAECYEQIVQAQDAAVRELQKVTKRKLEGLLSLEIELRRQEEELRWLNMYAKVQMPKGQAKVENLTKEAVTRFLKTWRSHVAIRNRIAMARPTEQSVLSSIIPDMTVVNNLRVSSESTPLDRKHTFDVKSGKLGSSSKVYATDNFVTKVDAAAKSKLFSLPGMSRDDIVTMSNQTTIDFYSERVQLALSEALEDGSMILPHSISKPPMSGALFNSSELLNAYQDGLPSTTARESYDSVFLMPGESIHKDRNTPIQEKMKEENVPVRKNFSASNTTSQRRDIPTVSGPGKEMNRMVASTLPDNSMDMATIVKNARKVERLRPQHSRPNPFPNNTSSIPNERYNEELITDKSMSLDELLEVTEDLHDQSLVNFAQRKIEQLGEKVNGVSPDLIFCDSRVFHELEAQTLYYTLPFFVSAPVCSLIYSTELHKRGLDELYIRCAHSRTACVVAIKSGDFVFGAYLSHPLHLSGIWSGSPSSFIFSSTLGLKLAYHGRFPPEKHHENGNMGPASFFADLDQLLIGNGDIVIDNTVRYGKSNVEHCYGVGLDKDGIIAHVLLAGSTSFEIDVLEVWAIG